MPRREPGAGRTGCAALIVMCCLLVADPAQTQLRLESVLGATEADGFARADVVRPFEFPDDHGPHEDFRSEWWYLTVNLRDADGAAFGVQFTAFRQATAPPGGPAEDWATRQVYLAHLAVTDVAGRRHQSHERLARGHPRLAGARADPFAVWVDGWRLAAVAEGFAPLRLEARARETVVDLVLEPVKPLVLQGDRGLSAKGPGQASYYYSLPRLSASGALELDGVRHAVQGFAWFDREWSTSLLSAGQIGWDWFGLQFDDGEELMAFRLRRDDGTRDPYDHGSWIARDGRARHLGPADFELVPLRYWRDRAGVRWPVEWEIRLADRAPLRVVAALDDQRMDTLLVYWEGLVRVLDERGRRIGAGYMELTGYD